MANEKVNSQRAILPPRVQTLNALRDLEFYFINMPFVSVLPFSGSRSFFAVRFRLTFGGVRRRMSSPDRPHFSVERAARMRSLDFAGAGMPNEPVACESERVEAQGRFKIPSA